MNYYATGAAVSFLLFLMGLIALVIGYANYRTNRQSRATQLMLYSCLCVFFWDAGYGLMGLCYMSDVAYIPRAIALLSIYLYVYVMVMYVAELGHLSKPKLRIVLGIGMCFYLTSWFFIIRKDAVTFEMTPWGYWYYSKMSSARIVQFVAALFALTIFYVALFQWKKKVSLLREKGIINRFMWFAPVIIAGYAADTLVPSIFHTPAVPGSAVGAFVSVMILYSISLRNKAFGASVTNVAEYVFKEVNTPVIVLNYLDEVVLYNDIARDLFGFEYSRKEAITLEGRIEEDRTYTDEEEIYKIVKTERYCKFERSTIYDSYGEVLHTIIFAPDVTANIEAMKLAEESRRLAEEANVSKSNFLANMSHEIRTPMNAIVGMSDILLKNPNIDEEGRNQLNNIKIAGDGLLGIINDILDLSKIESGKAELIEDTYSTPSLINDVSTIISVRLQETGIKLSIEVPDDFPMDVCGDEIRVRQIIMNIMGNACKYTKKGSVGLRCDYTMDGEDCILGFHVTDTGMGIKAEDIDKIFGAFNQVDTRKNRNVQGTGLGLAISRNLAMMMDGDITVESEYGVGSTFHISVKQKCENYKPIGHDIATALNNMNYRKDSAKEEIVIVPRPDKKVLVVDDIPVNLMVAKGLMRPYKLQIDVAESGFKAIEMVKENDYDLVFMDHMMPEMDGVDTTHAIRDLEGEKYKNLIIVALTANAVGDAKDALIAEGMQDFLAKPIEKRELNRVIEKWL